MPDRQHSLSLQILALTAARTVLNTMHRLVYPFLLVFGRSLGVGVEALAAALFLRSVVGIAGPFLSGQTASRSRKFSLLLGLLLFTASMALAALWPTYYAFAAAMVLAAAGKFIFDPAMQAYLGDEVPYARRGRALAVTELSWSLSFIIGVPLCGIAIARFGWRAPFPVLGVLSLAAAGWLAAVLPNREVHGEEKGLFRSLGRVLASPPAITGLGMGLLINAANEVVNLVFGVWMEDAFGLQIAALGLASAVVGFSELAGEGLVGWLTDGLGKTRAVAAGLAANSLAALLLPVLGTSQVGALAGLFLFYITFEFTLVSTIPLMTEVLPSARVAVMAANVAGLSLGRALGAVLAAPLYLLGMGANAAGTAVLNLLALAALIYLHKKTTGPAQRPPAT